MNLIIWHSRKKNQYFIDSNSGYKISFAQVEGNWRFGAWPSDMRGNLYGPPRKEGMYSTPLGIFDTLGEAKYCCEVDFCKQNDIQPREYDPVNYGEAPAEQKIEVKKQKAALAMPPPKPKDKEKGENKVNQSQPKKRRSQCNVEELVAFYGMSEGQARHVVQAREEKEENRKRAKKACQLMANCGVEGFGYSNKQIDAMRPKALEGLIQRATEEYKKIKAAQNEG